MNDLADEENDIVRLADQHKGEATFYSPGAEGAKSGGYVEIGGEWLTDKKDPAFSRKRVKAFFQLLHRGLFERYLGGVYRLTKKGRKAAKELKPK